MLITITIATHIAMAAPAARADLAKRRAADEAHDAVGASSSMSSSQRQDSYDSSSSIRTTRTSGMMIVCPACQGLGH